MSRKKRYIEKLTEEQKSSLKKGCTHGKSSIFRRKCHSILLSNEGKSVKEICSVYGVTQGSVYGWFNDWESDGIAGLKLKPGQGRKPKLNLANDKQVTIVKKLVKNEPKNLNKVVAGVKIKLDIDLSKKTLKRFLKNLSTPGNASANG